MGLIIVLRMISFSIHTTKLHRLRIIMKKYIYFCLISNLYCLVCRYYQNAVKSKNDKTVNGLIKNKLINKLKTGCQKMKH